MAYPGLASRDQTDSMVDGAHNEGRVCDMISDDPNPRIDELLRENGLLRLEVSGLKEQLSKAQALASQAEERSAAAVKELYRPDPVVNLRLV